MRLIRFMSAAVALALAALALRSLFWIPLQCNRSIGLYERSTERAVNRMTPYQASVQARRNLDELRVLERTCPPDVNIPMLIAANYRVLDRKQDALDAYRSALAIEQRPEIYFNLGLMELELGHRERGVEYLSVAARFDRTLLGAIGDPDIIEEVRQRLQRLTSRP